MLSIDILAKGYRRVAFEIYLRILLPSFLVAQNYFKHESKKIIKTKYSRGSSLILWSIKYLQKKAFMCIEWAI